VAVKGAGKRGVDVVVVEIDGTMRDRLIAAQTRQEMINRPPE
jgi:hypothetical protein